MSNLEKLRELTANLPPPMVDRRSRVRITQRPKQSPTAPKPVKKKEFVAHGIGTHVQSCSIG